MKIDVKDIIGFLGNQIIKVEGDVNKYVDNVADAEHTKETTLDWVNSNKADKQFITESSPAKVIVVDDTISYSRILAEKGKTIIVVSNPRLIMAKIISKFFLKKKNSYISSNAYIDKEAQIDSSAYIEAGCVIGNAIIGKNTIVCGNVTIYDGVVIGDDCIIQAGTVIGTDGLGCSRESDGTLIKFPHLGGVRIGDNVEIGANCQIARGVFSDTIINNGCKINGLCFIAHNCILGENVWITGDTMLSGSTHVGKNTTIFSNVVVRDQCHIGENVVIGMGAVVTKDVPSGEVWYGSPAKKIR